MTRPRGLLLLLPLLLLDPSGLEGQGEEGASGREPGSSLRVSLLTMGQGELVWQRFGHNAILIQDEATGWQAAYNWGVFDFDQVDFVPRLIEGTMLYRMERMDPEMALMGYRREGRSVWVQELLLSPSQRRELLELVEENALPENRDYRYDYYRDNCSTRVRDALDTVLDGQLESLFSSDTTTFSYRWHTRRILREMPLYYLGIQYVLGPKADEPLTIWEEMFLPRTLRIQLQEVRLSDGEGGTRPLVTDPRLVLDSGRSGPPATPPFALPLFLAAGLLWAGGFLLFSGKGSELGKGRRLGLFLMGGGWGVVAALAGSLLLGAWLFTDHVFWYANLNLFQTSPLFFPLPVAFLLFLFRDRFPGWGRNLALLLVCLSLAGVAVQLLPWVHQENGEILAFTLPVNLSLWVGTRRLDDRGRRARPAAGREVE